MLLGQLHDEPALAGANLQVEGPVISEQVLPVSAVVFGFLYDIRAGRDRVAGSRNISQTHSDIDSFL